MRRLGATDVIVSALGFGGGPIGGLRRAISDADAAATVDAAWARGIRYFDTAPLYGHGESERRLGAALSGRPRDEYVVSTKVGRLLVRATRPDFDRHGFVGVPPVEVAYDYSRDGVLRSLEASLARLGLDRVDIVLIHDPDRWTHADRQPEVMRQALDETYPTLADLKARGVIRAIGIGLNEWGVAEAFLRRAPLDCVLLAGRYTLLEQRAADTFLPLCAERGTSVIIGGPYNSGILATGAGPAAQYNYAPAAPEVVERVAALEAALAGSGVKLPSAALRFPLLHPAVASVIPGLMSPAEVDAAADALALEIPPAVWAALARCGVTLPTQL
jgi:D-threo-aldose 1-dehydrogenase